jgi:hypothetical protein
LGYPLKEEWESRVANHARNQKIFSGGAGNDYGPIITTVVENGLPHQIDALRIMLRDEEASVRQRQCADRLSTGLSDRKLAFQTRRRGVVSDNFPTCGVIVQVPPPGLAKSTSCGEAVLHPVSFPI